MTTIKRDNIGDVASIEQHIRSLIELLRRVTTVLAPPLLRIALAVPFFRSGLTKWTGFLSLSPTAEFLFEDQFKLHMFGQAYDFPLPTVFAWLDGLAEIVLPILLVVGLATRFSALGLLVMTGVIQLVVPEGWANFHLPWAALAVAIIAFGPGRLSLDHLIDRAFAKGRQLDSAEDRAVIR
jgi:putative oxidoreductase